MYSIDEINDMLDELASELPEELFRELNGGVNLLPDTKTSAADPDGRLYTLGEYCHNQMGRYINIYYGSIRAVHSGDAPDELRGALRKLLSHELTHHMESLSGERSLEIKDEIDLDRYLRGAELDD